MPRPYGIRHSELDSESIHLQEIAGQARNDASILLFHKPPCFPIYFQVVHTSCKMRDVYCHF